MTSWPLLSILIFLPIIGAVFIYGIRHESVAVEARNAKMVALWVSIITFVLSLFIASKFTLATAGDFQFVEKYGSIKIPYFSYVVGVDGISLPLILLTTFLMPLTILSSWHSVKNRVKEYMIAFLCLETMMIGSFSALNLILFYVFFEAVLIPMYLIIGIWGGKRRIYASFKFFLYTLLGSVLMLIAMMVIYQKAGTTDLSVLLTQHAIPAATQKWLWLAFFASFAVKVPMWPVHTWLPDAHVEAPTAGSVILAGVLLKMGGYGFLRLSLPLLPEASLYFAPLVLSLSVIAIIYTSLVAFVQEDMKKLIAYSSVAHMGFVTLGLASFNVQAMQGSMMIMISHGIVSAALFMCVGVVYDRLHTREISRYGGLVKVMPMYATVFMIFTMASVGLPGTSGFVGEFLSLLGTFQEHHLYAALASLGVVLGAVYALWLYRQVIFGALTKKDLKVLPDLTTLEVWIFVPLIALTIGLGIYPKPLLQVSQKPIEQILAVYSTPVFDKTTSPKEEDADSSASEDVQ